MSERVAVGIDISKEEIVVAVAPSGEGDETLEPGLVDLDFPGGRSNHLAIGHQEGFGGIIADRDLAGD